MSPEELHILRHALGLQEDGSRKSYRNYYAAEPDDERLGVLVSNGWMRHGRDVMGGLQYYHVTDEGIRIATKSLTVGQELTRAKKRYRQYLKSDSGLSFMDWLRYAEKNGYLES